MSTRANIKFKDQYSSIHIDRSHDGFPEVILPDIEKAVNAFNERFNQPEISQLVSIFLGIHYEEKTRVQPYEPCVGFEYAGDESYCYIVEWNSSENRYDYYITESTEI